ncbi:aromatic ring-hydroxylating dioxygenase subunit alpha [Calothrix sp. 336/3]|uniref:aromatic ring-hydroxylating dioxygenase subunit alpha n=1 Tax=Calothrix sp. 336/3 TaxID=1337936 RepID=UPI0004E34EC6|nr:Rieske 2Fe-2S domain-containing protein [Calothrix sp. 336/3]AKG21962.1 Pheophorbide a oxygenase [Calothrix sp. 336/3]
MSSEFNFFQHWYPIIPLIDLDVKKPTPAMVLGMRLVIWKPKHSEKFSVFLDKCPHRLAPLTEGRIDEETGNLMCSYHGWQFDDQGICTQIPQADNPEILSKNQENFCVQGFPTRQEQELLWVWLDLNSPELAAATPLPLSPLDESHGFMRKSLVRDLAYDWQTLIENVIDPSHVPFAHHGIQGDRRQAKPLPIQVSKSTANLIQGTISRYLQTTITFEPPCRLEYAITIGDTGKISGLAVYCLPVAPGKSRIVAQFPQNFGHNLYRFTPRWWDHLFNRNLVLDGDMVLLHQQEYFLQKQATESSWKTAYKLPTSADRLVIEFRKWFDRYCDGKLPWEAVGIDAATPLKINENRRELLDRYTQHTQHCSSCRGALQAVQRLQIVLLTYFILTVAGVAILPDSLRLNWGLPLMAIALVALGTYTWLKFWLTPKFYFVDYIHSAR